jgi:hypothetical protein
VSLLTASEYLNKPIFGDSLSRPSASMIITIRDIAQRTYTLELYRHADSGQSVPGLINGKQWAVFAPSKIDEIFRKRPFFKE